MICKYTECNKHRVKIEYENKKLKERLKLTEWLLSQKRSELSKIRLANEKRI